jgi:hypothetical protein
MFQTTDKRDLYTTCRVRETADLNGRQGEYARIISRVGDCYTIEFIDGSREGLVTAEYLERFTI